MSQIDVDGSVMSRLSQSHFAYRKVTWSTALKWQHLGLWARLTSAAAMLHATFHQASPFIPWVIFLAKNLPHVAFVGFRRSSLAHVRDGMSVIKGCGKRVNEATHSHFITSLIFYPISDGGGVGGISRGRSRKRAVWSEEINWSKDTEHVLGKNGLARNGRLMKK